MKNNEPIKLSESLQKWFNRYSSGVRFGYGKQILSIIWVSDDERFVIIKKRGNSQYNGRGCSVTTRYYPQIHWIADTTKGTYSDGNYFMKREGRLSEHSKQVMISDANRMRNTE
jgi:hypothetical protein